MGGIGTLQRRFVPFHAIAVITTESLLHPEEVFSFFLDNGIQRVGFNVEELEGANSSSSISVQSISKIRQFFETIARCQEDSKHKVWIREFHNAMGAIRGEHFPDHPFLELRNDQTLPFAILTVAWDGSVTTFSPELIDARSRDHGDFILGNIFYDELSDILSSTKFARMANAVDEGCRQCALTCQYFSVCAGGAPSNKYFENGRFESTETTYCRSVIQIPIDIMLAKAELQLGISVPDNCSERLV
jgi:uncharacterized protein